jgi:hypothetical protein
LLYLGQRGRGRRARRAASRVVHPQYVDQNAPVDGSSHFQNVAAMILTRKRGPWGIAKRIHQRIPRGRGIPPIPEGMLDPIGETMLEPFPVGEVHPSGGAVPLGGQAAS